MHFEERVEGRPNRDIEPRNMWSLLWHVPSGRWPAMRWGLAIILPIAVALWGFSFLIAPGEPDTLTIRVLSQVTGEGIEDARIRVGEMRYLTDGLGEIRIEPIEPGTLLSFSALGYESTQATFDESDGRDLTIALNGVLVMGAVTDAVSDEPIVGAQVTALDANGHAFSSTGTDSSGGFVFKSIPEDASFHVVDPLYGESLHSIDGRRSVPIRLDPPPVTGRVIDTMGQPVASARVAAPSSETTSDQDGFFSLDPVGQGSDVEISAEGHGSTIVLIEGTDLRDVHLPAPATPSPMAGDGL